MGWTQPQCNACWNRENPTRAVHALIKEARETETCCDCGEKTLSGIYVRKDPLKVAFPSEI